MTGERPTQYPHTTLKGNIVAAKLEHMANHPNRGSGRFNNAAANPTPTQVRALLEESKLTQERFGGLVYKSTRIVEDWLSGERRMPPDTFELLQAKVRAVDLLKRGRIAPQAVKDLGLQLPDEEG